MDSALTQALATISVSPRVARRSIQCAIESDPPLAIFAADRWLASSIQCDRSSSPQTATTAELAAHLCDKLVDEFASFDGLPPTNTSDALAKSIVGLRSQFRSLPIEDWLAHADKWFDAVGRGDESRWRASELKIKISPTDGDQNSMPDSSVGSVDVVQLLAGQARSLTQLESKFADRLAIEKRASLGQLAYGLSHEINNPLANISARAQSLMSRSSSSATGEDGANDGANDGASDRTLQQIVDQSYRAYGMIADLMFYARPPAAQKRWFDLSGILADVIDEFRSDDDQIEVAARIASSSSFFGDPTMIGEAIRMLIRNAAEAVMPVGKIVVELAKIHSNFVITIADSGPGLSDDARRHAMDPYFSGREAGRGLGMGLCRAIGVMEMHDGSIELSGGPVGCIATMTLPAACSVDNDLSGADETPSDR